jgi:cysteinyl-tRNA synthetase
MAEAHLGETIDIHGGGIDLVFPHHENEIAQSRCAHGTAHSAMAQIWMHNGFLQVDGAKMSKSLGNFVTIRDLLKDWPSEVIRLAMLMTHYRQPIDFTEDRLREAKKKLHKWYEAVEGADVQNKGKLDDNDRILKALSDDLDTWNAIGVLDSMVGEIAVTGGPIQLENKYRMRASAGLLGLLTKRDLRAWIESDPKSRLINEDKVQALIDDRAEARRQKDWARADHIRDELFRYGVQLKDAKNPETGELVTTWEPKR